MILLQLAVLAASAAGWGYWVWILLRTPAPHRRAAWLWCGLAGMCLGWVLLHALVYANFPLRRTVPWFALVAMIGLGALLVRLWRARAATSWRQWREVTCILGTGAAAALIQATSAFGIGYDRFLGHAQYDHVNYVMLTQFMIDEPFSTDLQSMGLRPWLVRPLGLKGAERTAECVPVGVAAVLTRTDAQEAWGATAAFFAALLAMALAGLWRVAQRVPALPAALLGLAGATLPVITAILLIGFFSQLTTLFVFPALIAVCWPGALRKPLAIVAAMTLLGFLAGAYMEFWPVGGGIVGGMVLGWRLSWLRRIGTGALVGAGSLLLNGGYVAYVPDVLLRLGMVQDRADWMSGFAPDGISWRGWARNFVAGSSPWIDIAGAVITAGVVLGLILQPAHRRWRWAAALAVPAAALAVLATRERFPVYAIYKILATLSPLCAGFAGLGFLMLMARFRPNLRGLAAGLLLVAAGAGIAASTQEHLRLMRRTAHEDRAALQKLWSARERVRQDPDATYLVEAGNSLMGAWLAYFARDTRAYYDLPAISDRRVPTDGFPFRRIPAGEKMQWLALDRTGPVAGREPSCTLVVEGAREAHLFRERPLYILERETRLVITRPSGFMPELKEFILEAGIAPMPGIGPMIVVITDPQGVSHEFPVSGPSPVALPLRLAAGSNSCTLIARPTSRNDAASGLLLLQTLSLELPGATSR